LRLIQKPLGKIDDAGECHDDLPHSAVAESVSFGSSENAAASDAEETTAGVSATIDRNFNCRSAKLRCAQTLLQSRARLF
jgi:hypothetical protein